MFPNSDQKIINIQVIEEEKKISRYVDYLNNPKPNQINFQQFQKIQN